MSTPHQAPSRLRPTAPPFIPSPQPQPPSHTFILMSTVFPRHVTPLGMLKGNVVMAYASEGLARQALERKAASPFFKERLGVVARVRASNMVGGTAVVVVGEYEKAAATTQRRVLYWVERIVLVR